MSTAAVLLTGAGVALAQTAGADAVPLGTAGSFVVLAGAGITNTGPTTLNGDIGTFPTTTTTGTGSMTINGTDHGGDSVTQGAKTDLDNAYTLAENAGPSSTVGALGGGQVLTPGVYSSGSTIGLTGTLTLDGQGDPDAVFIFQAGSSLTTASSSTVLLTRDAQACNVFWQVGSSATLGTDSRFIGTVLAQTSITLTTRAVVDGRVLAQDGAVTLDSNTITRPTCAAAPEPEPTAGPTTTPTTQPTGTPTTTPTGTPTTGTPTTATPTTAPGVPVGTTGGPTGTTTTGTPTGTTTTTGTTTGITTGTAIPPGGTSRQITRVPRGGVPAGDGSTAGGSGPAAPTALLGLAVLAGIVAARRRRTA